MAVRCNACYPTNNIVQVYYKWFFSLQLLFYETCGFSNGCGKVKVDRNSFQHLSMARSDNSLSLDATIMVSKNAQPLMNTLVSFLGHNCWFSVSRHSKQTRIKIKTVQQIKSSTCEKKERQLCKDSHQDSGHSNFSYARYTEKLFPQNN